MYRLVIDIGNTYFKAALGKNYLLKSTFKKFPYDKKNFKSDFTYFLDRTFVKQKEKIFQVGISLCNIGYKKFSERIIKQLFFINPYFISYDSKLPIKIKYPKTLGIDRICSSVGAVRRYSNKSEILVIDFGTATTFNLIINNTFIGGMISAGIATSLKSLIQSTDLPKVKIDINKITITPRNTISAINSGILYQTISLTNFVINELKKRYNNLITICTGGYGEVLSKKIKEIKNYYPHLVLEGANEILKLNSED
ncbi:MAG: type III pantothenate kinase [Ignavibacteria bacterium]|nr:type III pantothenate kinase [Ignavibacteria bacterium]